MKNLKERAAIAALQGVLANDAWSNDTPAAIVSRAIQAAELLVDALDRDGDGEDDE